MTPDALSTVVAGGPQPLLMTHPDVEGPAPTSQEAFDTVWGAKGWQLVPTQEVAEVLAEQQAAADVAAELAAVTFAGHTEDEYTKDYLIEAANQRGVDSTGTKAEILARLQAAEDVSP
jgi:hypothetical protein